MRQTEVNKEMLAINDTLEQMNFIDAIRTLHSSPSNRMHILKCTWNILKHMLEHKTSLNKLKKTEVISSISSDHKNMNLEMKYKKQARKKSQMCGDRTCRSLPQEAYPTAGAATTSLVTPEISTSIDGQRETAFTGIASKGVGQHMLT